MSGMARAGRQQTNSVLGTIGDLLNVFKTTVILNLKT